MVTPDGKQPHSRAKLLTTGDRTPLAARLAESTLADVLLVIEWAHTAPDSWWLEQGALGLGTLTRAKGWSDRIEKAHAWADGGRRSTKAPRASDERLRKTSNERARAEVQACIDDPIDFGSEL
jgi:hypothetical protein